jgi:hypothetical protein
MRLTVTGDLTGEDRGMTGETEAFAPWFKTWRAKRFPAAPVSPPFPFPSPYCPSPEQLNAARRAHTSRWDDNPWRLLKPRSEEADDLARIIGYCMAERLEFDSIIGPSDEKGSLFDPGSGRRTIRALLAQEAALDRLDVRTRALSFMPGRQLVDLAWRDLDGEPLNLRFVVATPDVRSLINYLVVPLPGVSIPIHAMCVMQGWHQDGISSLDFETPGLAEDYLRFFCDHVSGSEPGQESYFSILESPKDISMDPEADLKLSFEAQCAVTARGEPLDPLRPYIHPITRIAAAESTEPSAPPRFVATLLFQQILFSAVFTIDGKGAVGMQEDLPLLDGKKHPFLHCDRCKKHVEDSRLRSDFSLCQA